MRSVKRMERVTAVAGLLIVGVLASEAFGGESVKVIEDGAPVLRQREVIAKLKKGDVVKVIERRGMWLGVRVDTPEGRTTGWIHAKYTAPLTETGPPPDAPAPVEPGGEAAPQPAEQEQQQTVLKSTGVPSKKPEDILPAGALVHVRLNNAADLVNTLDSLIMTFVPDKAVPPHFKQFLDQPKPVLAVIGAQTIGQPLTPASISAMLGIALDRPVTLSVYVPEPARRFVLSVPMSDPKALTAMLMNILRPRAFVSTAVGKHPVGGVRMGYHIAPTNRDMPRDLYVVCSDTTAYICGSPKMAEALYATTENTCLRTDPAVARTVQNYTKGDLTVLTSIGFIKPFLPRLAEQFSVIPPRMIQRFRRQMIRAYQSDLTFQRVVWRLFHTTKIEPILDYVECVATASYEVLFSEIHAQAKALEGFALCLDIDAQFQRMTMAFYSQKIDPKTCRQPLPMAALGEALASLPGDRSMVRALGKLPAGEPSPLKERWLSLMTERMDSKGLSMNVFNKIAQYLRKGKPAARLEAKVDWVLRSRAALPKPAAAPEPDPNTILEYVEALMQAASRAPGSVRLTTMPARPPGFLEDHYRNVATTKNEKDKDCRDFLQQMSLRPPFYDRESRFRVESAADGGKRLVVEDAYMTRTGFFGYTQHELINRQALRYRTVDGFTFLYPETPGTQPPALGGGAATPLSPAIAKLLNRAPAGVNSLDMARHLQRLRDVVEFLGKVEDLAHKELAAYLANAERLVAAGNLEELTRDDPPILMLSLNKDAQTGKLYCVLPGGICYPRPKLVPTVRSLLEGYLEKADEVGGAVAFTRAVPGAYEIHAVQSTEALALLVKTTGNRVYEQFLSSQEGMQKARQLLVTPRDGRTDPEEALVWNTFWEFFTGGLMGRRRRW